MDRVLGLFCDFLVMSLMLIMGIPAAGKTTICQSILNWRSDTIIFAFDGFAAGNVDKYTTAHTVRKNFESSIRNYLTTHSAESDEFKRLVIIDDNFYLRSMRRPFERMARTFRMSFHVLYIPCNVDLAIERNEKRDEHEKVGVSTIRRMYRELEVPIDAIRYYEDKLDVILALVIEKERPESGTKRSNAIGMACCSKLEHLCLECGLRAVVSDLVKNSKYDGKRMSIAKKKVAKVFREMGSCSYDKNELRARILNAYGEEW